MVASSAGSDVFALFALLAVSIFVLLLLRYYLPLRTTPSYILLPIFLALTLPISIILLVPIDLASSSRAEDEAARGIWLPNAVMLVTWRIAYWLTFCLSWFILPVLGEYVDSGYRTPKDRIVYSLKANARYQLIVLACIIVGLVYVIMQNGFHGASLKSLAMALSYSVGLVQAIYLMGHGLVAIPRRLFHNASTSGRLRRLQAQAPKVHEKMEEAVAEMSQLEEQLKELEQRKNGISRDHQEWIEELVDTTPLAYTRLSQAPLPTSTRRPSLPAVITDRYLADLSRRLSRSRHRRLRYISTWHELVSSAITAQFILDSRTSRKLDFGSPPSHSLFPTILTPPLRYHLHVHIFPLLRIVLGGILSLASVCIIWSELIHHWAPSLSLISRTVILHPTSSHPSIPFPTQTIACVWLIYMSLAALSPLPSLYTWRSRALVHRATSLESACWYALQTAKLTVPLTYNFLTFTPAAIYEKTSFYAFLGQYITLTPLGTWFDNLFPLFILVPVLAALFNLYARAGAYFGASWLLQDEDEDAKTDGFATAGWREGRALIERARLDGEDSGSVDGTALGNTRGARASPSLYIPPVDARPSGSQALRPAQVRPPMGAGRAGVPLEAEEEEGAFAGFAHRVRNTLDQVDTPEWLGKRPRWMGGDGEGTDDSARAGSGSGLGRWFGGRPADGRVRLG